MATKPTAKAKTKTKRKAPRKTKASLAINKQKEALESKFNEFHALSTLARQNTFAQFGMQYKGDRDLNEALGWEDEPVFRTYAEQYRRGGIAKTIVNIKPEDTWRGDITVTALQGGESDESKAEAKAFETKWLDIWRKLRMKEYFLRADKMAGIGQYSVMRLGFKEPGQDTVKSTADQADTKIARREMLRKPVTAASELIFVSVFSQLNAELVNIFDLDTDARFGHVEEYQLTEANELVKDINGKTGTARGVNVKAGVSVNIHADRIIHIAENLLEDEVLGTPRLECVLNHLYDLQKVSGGSAEMYWRGAFPGYNFELDPEAELSSTDLTDMAEQIDDMIMGLKRYIKTQGVEAKSLAPQVADPEKQVDIQISQIAGATRIPRRKLLGNEAGDLASTQDEQNWDTVIQGRRENDCERWVRDWTNRLMKYEILPKVENYAVNWPSLVSENEQIQSETALNRTKAITEYVQKGGNSLVPEEEFLTDIMGFDKEKVDKLAHLFVIKKETGLEGDDELEDELNGVKAQPGRNGDAATAQRVVDKVMADA